MRRDDDVLLTLSEAAESLSVNPATVWRYIKAGDLKPARAEKPYMLWKSDVEAFAPNAHKRPGPKRRPAGPPGTS
jgi:predicted site-specific integrase-resolvase